MKVSVLLLFFLCMKNEQQQLLQGGITWTHRQIHRPPYWQHLKYENAVYHTFSKNTRPQNKLKKKTVLLWHLWHWTLVDMNDYGYSWHVTICHGVGWHWLSSDFWECLMVPTDLSAFWQVTETLSSGLCIQLTSSWSYKHHYKPSH